MNNRYEEAKKILNNANQDHLLRFYDNLEEEKKEILINEILNIDFNEINELYKHINDKKENLGNIEPIMYVDKEKMSEEEKQHYKNIGIEEIKNGKVAVVTMAGGQGTRLRA